MLSPRSANETLRIIVLGYIIRGPLGGLAWHHLQYVKGLADLGHDVHFLEDSDDYPSCYDPTRNVTDADPSYGLAFAREAFARVGLPDCWAYHDAHTHSWHGPLAGRVPDICSTADVVLNVSGVNPLRDWLLDIPVRVFIDTDPVFTQVRHLTVAKSRKQASAHTSHFTFGENFGGNGCTMPDDGYAWLRTRQPICLDVWPVTVGPEEGRFTTVLQWDSYPAQEFRGVRYGMKRDAFRPFLHLPSEAGSVFELALGSPHAPREDLIVLGWHLRDPLAVTRDPWIYQQYIQESKAEFSVAKQGYVVSRSGWFSERSAAYMASGRPVVVQDTGFGNWLSCDGGVVTFQTLDQAVDAIHRVDRDYPHHCRQARSVVAEYFDAGTVLTHLIDRAA